MKTWIAVTERLPAEKGDTLCYGPGLGTIIAEFGAYPDGGGSWYADGEVWFPGTDVTHWMPLPDPPATDT